MPFLGANMLVLNKQGPQQAPCRKMSTKLQLQEEGCVVLLVL